jgi:hypothetical protein
MDFNISSIILVGSSNQEIHFVRPVIEFDFCEEKGEKNLIEGKGFSESELHIHFPN